MFTIRKITIIKIMAYSNAIFFSSQVWAGMLNAERHGTCRAAGMPTALAVTLILLALTLIILVYNNNNNDYGEGQWYKPSMQTICLLSSC